MIGAIELIKNVLAGWVLTLMLGGALADFVRAWALDRCSAEPDRVDGSTWVALALGLFAAGWIAGRIFWPRIISGIFVPTFVVGGAFVRSRAGAAAYGVPSNHPSYVIVDGVILTLALLLFLIGREPYGCTFAWEYWRGTCALALAVAVPLARLIAWFPLGLKVKGAKPGDAWGPVLFFGAVALIPGSIGAAFYGQYLLARHRAPVGSEQTMRGGLSENPELAGPVVRLVGTLKSGEAVRCRCRTNDPESCMQAEALLDLGEGGEVVVFGGPHDADELRTLASRGAGRKLQVFGRLMRRLPESDRLCNPQAYGEPPAEGRAILVMERP